MRLIAILLTEGGYVQKYVVEAPDGVKRGKTFDSLDDIPDEIEGSFGTKFDADEGTIIPVLVEATENAPTSK